MEPENILIFATVIITANGVPYEETHVQVDLGRPYYRVYPGLHIQENGQLLSNGHTTGEQCVDACEQNTACGSVDYSWLIGYCLRFRNSFSDRMVQTGESVGIVHVEVNPGASDGGDSVHVPGSTIIAGWYWSIHLGYAYGYPYDSNSAHKIATKENMGSGMECIGQCKNTSGCQAVNYRWMDGHCVLLTSGMQQDQRKGIIGHLGIRADYVHVELWNPITQPRQTAPGPNMALLMDQVRLAGQGTGQQMAHGMGTGSQTGQGSGTGRSMNQGIAPQTGRGSNTGRQGHARFRSSGGSK